MPHFTSLRSLLEVDQSVTQKELKKAYYKVSRKYHPDLNKEEEAKIQMQKITNAYEILCDPKKMIEFKKERGEKVKAAQKAVSLKKKKMKSRKKKRR